MCGGRCRQGGDAEEVWETCSLGVGWSGSHQMIVCVCACVSVSVRRACVRACVWACLCVTKACCNV